MTSITIFQNPDGVTGFHCIGHSGYAKAGQDIICAAVSVLVINTVNAIETFTSSPFHLETEEESALIDFRFVKKPDHDAALLTDTMILGLQGIQNTYGNENFILDFKEV